MVDLGGVPSSWLHPVPASAAVAIREVNQEDLLLHCHPAFQINKSKNIKSSTSTVLFVESFQFFSDDFRY